MEQKKQPPKRAAKRQVTQVVNSRWLALASECASRFCLSAVLAAGKILGSSSPFALGFVAASGSAAGGFFALIGAGLGFFLSMPISSAFRYLATAILIYAVAFAFYDLRIYSTRFFMPLSAMVLTAVTGFVSLAESSWSSASVISFLTELVLVLLSARFYRVCFQPDAEEDQRRTARLLALGTLAISLHGVGLPFHLTLGAAMCACVALWAGYCADTATCITVSLCLGLCLDLAEGGGTIYAAALGVGGLLSGVSARWGRHISVLSFLAGVLALTLWSFPITSSFLPLWNSVLGSCIYLALPAALLEKRNPFPAQPPIASPPAAAPTAAAVPAMAAPSLEPVQAHLKQQSAAFHVLYERLSSDLTDSCGQEDDGFALLERASRQVCHGCAFQGTCWKRERTSTRDAVRPALAALKKRGRIEQGDFAAAFSARCTRLAALVKSVNSEYAFAQTRRRYQLKLLEGRRNLCRQYEQTARLLNESALALDAQAVPAMKPTVLSALAGVAAGKRPGQEVSGDAGGWFRDEQGVLWVVLCDGMGSGPEAARDSRFAYHILEQFLTSGITPETALATVAGAMTLRWEEHGSFTTIDLLRLDLTSGDGAVYKLGAAPTYLRRDGALMCITSDTLPAGLSKDSPPDVNRFRLRPGDLAVLVSDGVTDGADDGWVREKIRAFTGDSPKDLAASLLMHDNPAADDRTAIVLYLEGKGAV